MKKSLLCLLLAALMLFSAVACASSADDEGEYIPTEAAEISALMKLGTTDSTGYLCALTGDEEKDAAIWAYVNEIYEDFRARYDEILAAGDATIDTVGTNTQDYTDKVAYTFSHKSDKAAPTRTIATLTNFKEDTTAAFDEYGGWVNEKMKQEAKGYYYTAKIDGRWYFIDPLGYPCILSGFSGMTYSYAGSKHHSEVTRTKWGTYEKWAIAATRDLDEYYVNARSVIDVADPWLRDVQYKIPYQDKLGFVSDYERLIGGYDTNNASGSTILLYGMHVFDLKFEAWAQQYAYDQITKDGYYDDPYFIGYALDNEIPVNQDMLTQYMYLDKSLPINYYSYAAAWTFAVRETGKTNPTPLDITKYEIQDLFRAFVYDRYFSVAVSAVKAVDDRHLILGTRALNIQRDSEGINRVSGYWCDVLSYNWYQEWTPSATQLNNISKWSGKPFIITEFYAMAQECEMNLKNALNTITPKVATQAERGKFYQNYCLKLLECDNMVGWYWFNYLEATPGDGYSTYMNEDTANTGLYSNNLNIYTDFAKYVGELNRNKYTLIQYFD